MKVRLEYIGYKKWKLMETFRVWSKENKSLISVPKGFVTDLASTPKFLWFIFEPFNKNYMEPSIVHDFLYNKKSSHKFNRKEADKIFLQLMKEYGANKLKRNLIYLGARLFGSTHYKKR